MSRRPVPVLLLILTLVLGTFAPADARTVRRESIRLAEPADVARERGQLRGDDLASYTVFAREGQTLHIGVRSRGGPVRFLVQGPLGSRTVAGGGSGGEPVQVRVRQTGGHRIALILTDEARSEGAVASYVLRVSFQPLRGAGPRPAAPDLPEVIGEAPEVIEDAPEVIEEEPELPVLPEPSDLSGLPEDDEAGGPDFWQVRGLGGNLLAVRAGPGVGYGILAQLPEGAVVANLGCRGRDDQRWCRIEVEALDLEGWSSGRYLREAAGPPPDRSEGRPEGSFDASGRLPCAADPFDPLRACAYLLRHGREGRVRLWVEVARDRWRRIQFDDGLPLATNAEAPMDVDLEGRLFRIAIGRERFEVPADLVRPR